MKTIYVGYDGTRMECEQKDIEVRIPILFKYYRTLDSFSLFIDPKVDIYRQMRKNMKNKPELFEYAHGVLICPSGEFSNPDAWEVEGIESMPEDMQERLRHYWTGYTTFFFQNYCNENTRLWRSNETTLADRFYLNNGIISEARDCTFILTGEDNGIRFSQLSNVLIHIFGNYYEVE